LCFIAGFRDLKIQQKSGKFEHNNTYESGLEKDGVPSALSNSKGGPVMFRSGLLTFEKPVS
jgi:hypothetical protein